MSGFKNGTIDFDSRRIVFYTGQEITGRVIFDLDEPMTLTTLYISYRGEAVVSWKENETETYNGELRNKEVLYTGKEEYLDYAVMVYSNSAPIDLSAGHHAFPFRFKIPTGVPSTFRSERGNIIYQVKASLQLRGQTVINEGLSKEFEVVAPFDLNRGTGKFKEPINFEFQEIAKCGCLFGFSPIKLKVQVPVCGFCPGQKIPISVVVENNSRVEITGITFQLVKRQQLKSLRPYSEYIPPEEVIATLKKSSVMSRAVRTITFELPVPDFIVPNLENCSIIAQTYFLRVFINLSGCNETMEDEAQVYLGLVPIKETVNGEYVHPMAHSLPEDPMPVLPKNRFRDEVSGIKFQPTELGHQNAPYFTQGPQSAGDTGSYTVQSHQQYSSTVESQTYHLGFTVDSGASQHNMTVANTKTTVHLPPLNVDIRTPTAPPPSS